MNLPISGFPFRQVFRVRCVVTLVLVGAGFSGCASHPARNAVYQAAFTATRLKDHSTLVTALVPLVPGETAAVQTSSRNATEDTPALPRFSARLTTTRTPGTFQIITRVTVLEAARNKKGKLKRSKRYEGSLLPIKLGEKQLASPPADPVQIDVEVQRR